MTRKQTGLLALIKGLKPVDASALADYEREMTEEAIPAIIRAVERRQMLAEESRRRLFTPEGVEVSQ